MSMINGFARKGACVAALFSFLVALPAQAVQFDVDWFGGLSGTWNNSIQLGAQWRMESRSPDLVGKLQNNPNLCPVDRTTGAGTSCQGHSVSQDPMHGPGPGNLDLAGFIGEGPGANQAFVSGEGQYSNNNDDGNLNYDKGDITQLVGRATSDLTINWKDLTFFGRVYYFYDFENQDPVLKSNSRVTPEQVAARRAAVGPGTVITPNGAAPVGLVRRAPGINETIPVTTKSNSLKKQIAEDIQLLDFNVSGNLPFFGDRELSYKIGRQSINWGESTLLIVNSLNTFNPPNVNNLFRPAFLDLAEVLTPIGAVSLSTNLTDNLSLETFYQYDWAAAEIPAPGSYLSFIDVGSDETRDGIQIGFGKGADNPQRAGIANNIALSPLTDTDGIAPILDENKARRGDQFGAVLRYYADWLNDGTELAFYAANYHSRLPYASFYAGDYGCLSDPSIGAPADVDPVLDPTGAIKGANDTGIITSAAGCPSADLTLAVNDLGPRAAAGSSRDQFFGTAPQTDFDAFNSDTFSVQLEYPEDIKLYGISFNTSFGDVSMQGEVAYRPNAPLQIATIDLGFAAINPTFPRGNGRGDESDFYSINLGGENVAGAPGRRYALPDFVTQFRGINAVCTAGEIAADESDGDGFDSCLTPGDYIRGYERMGTYQFNLGTTYIQGPENWINADQIIWFGEAGATWVPDLPDKDVLQFEGPPAAHTHASAGTDGTGASGDALANTSVRGPSGLRFNPTQQDTFAFADKLSYGYRVIAIIRYDSVLPNISFENTVVWWHDVKGIAPGPGENFIEGRKIALAQIEMRYKQNWSFALGGAIFAGGERAGVNLLRDRDFLNLGVRYRF